MSKPFIFIILLLLSACVDRFENNKEISGTFSLYRAETSEVVCFQAYSQDNIWCHWKGEK